MQLRLNPEPRIMAVATNVIFSNWIFVSPGFRKDRPVTINGRHLAQGIFIVLSVPFVVIKQYANILSHISIEMSRTFFRKLKYLEEATKRIVEIQQRS
jgi:hypothetical protein